MKTVLVTGGAGFIGSHLVDALVARGCDVAVLDDLSTGKKENLSGVFERIRFIEGSVADFDTVASAAHGVDTIVHLAAVASVPKTIADPNYSHSVNVNGTFNVLETARQNGARVVYASSCAVYGDDPELPKRETSPVAPKSPYALQKYIGEQYAQMYRDMFGVQSVGLRFFNVYGPRQDATSPYSGVISIFLKKIANEEGVIIFGDGKTTRDFVYVGDVVAALSAAAERADTFGVYAIGTGIETSLTDMVSLLGQSLGVEPSVSFVPERAGDIRRSVSDSSRAQKDLNWKADTVFKEGIEKLCKNLHK